MHFNLIFVGLWIDQIPQSILFILHTKSPPAWTQKGYRPPRIKYSICCPIPGGTPFLGRGYPSLDGGYAIQGTPCPDLAGGTPCPDLAGGTPFLDGGYPILGALIWTWPGYPLSGPCWGTSCLDLVGVSPCLDLVGVPSCLTWLGYPSIQTWLEYPHPIWTWPEYPPPPMGVDKQTNWNYYLSSSFGCGR